MALLEVKNLKKSFSHLEVLKGISFSIDKGEIISILGKSGGGKTTLLRCLNFLETPDSGEIILNNEKLFSEDLLKHRRRYEKSLRKKRLNFGLVFQSFNLFPQYTVLQNITLALKILKKEEVKENKKKYKKILREKKVELKKIQAEINNLKKLNSVVPSDLIIKRNKKIDEKNAVINNFNLYLSKSQASDSIQKAKNLLKTVNLEEKEDAYPHQLSGGQQQRVAIARALALSPSILCFDEPTSALDPSLTGEVLKAIKNLKCNDRAMIIVTHEIKFAKEVSDKIILIQEGKIVECSSPNEFFSPENKNTQEFLKYEENS